MRIDVRHAGFMIYLKTGSGQIVIETIDPNVQVAIEKSGKVYDEFTVERSPMTTTVAVGQYQIKLKGDSDSLRIEGGVFTLNRGDSRIGKTGCERARGQGRPVKSVKCVLGPALSGRQ